MFERGITSNCYLTYGTLFAFIKLKMFFFVCSSLPHQSTYCLPMAVVTVRSLKVLSLTGRRQYQFTLFLRYKFVLIIVMSYLLWLLCECCFTREKSIINIFVICIVKCTIRCRTCYKRQTSITDFDSVKEVFQSSAYFVKVYH